MLRVVQDSEIAQKAVLVVVIPAYRAAQSIAATLDSVLAQTFQDFEIIVVNDGSPDREELEKVLAPYRGCIIYLRQDNQGLAGAHNTGIQVARGNTLHCWMRTIFGTANTWQRNWRFSRLPRPSTCCTQTL